MPFNFSRFQYLPCIIKLTTLSTTILIILSVGSAHVQPSGTSFIWTTAMFSLIIDVTCIVILGFELEDVLLYKSSTVAFFTWPLVECVLSILFSIMYFISVWLSVNGANFGSKTAFASAGILCFVNFLEYSYNVFVYTRLWVAENRKASNIINTNSANIASYGGP